jgi:hypothetical protein
MIIVFIGIGFLISMKITGSQMKKNKEYDKAVKITSKEMLQEAINNKVENAFIYGDLKAIDTLTCEPLQGEFLFIKLTEQEYVEKIYTKTVNGKTKRRGKWKVLNTESDHSDKIMLLGVEFNTSNFRLPVGSGELIHSEGNRQQGYKIEYHGCKANCTGTIYVNLQDNASTGDVSFFYNQTIDQTIKYLESDVMVKVFWVFWGILTLICVGGFCWIGNKCMQ